MYYIFSRNEGADQLHCCHAADLGLCFHIHVYAKSRFSHDVAHVMTFVPCVLMEIWLF